MAAPGSTPPRRTAGGPGEPPGSRDEETAREAARHSLLFSLLLLGALLAARLPFPWSAVGLLFTVAALVVGGLGLAAALRARRRGTAAVLVGGLVLALFVLLSQAAALLVWPVQEELRECLSGAVTDGARTQCQNEFTDGITRWADELTQLAGG
ncbi:hypothetical protein [uncultured Pseudokineococcus sp.]|uniref:hypothetical protein n=1 Tax=uncultured Pseudokineococcus sp. TaxID=1642928 RepID=UPI002638807A|nr:hypothetical protein [uncultured Pseudokineococcus sp.]